MLTFMVPPGIGDFSAMYSKLCGLNREISIQVTRDGPNRLLPFLDILPNIKSSGYGMFGTGITLTHTLPPGTDLQTLPEDKYFLSINNWLENGGTVDAWIPGPTDYHFPFNIPDNLIQAARNTLKEVEGRPLIGVYTSAYGNARHWGFWGPQDWCKFLKLIYRMVPKETVFVFIGAEYDLGISAEVHAMLREEDIPSLYTLGDFHIGSTIELIRHLSYFFIFPSGLGFLADVVNTPNLMWFPEHLKSMRYTFTDPKNVEDGISSHALYMTPEAQALIFERGVGLPLFQKRSAAHA